MTMKQVVEEAVSRAFKKLIEDKHLYQYVALDVDFIKTQKEQLILDYKSKSVGVQSLDKSRAEMYMYKIEGESTGYPENKWFIRSTKLQEPVTDDLLITLPTVRIYCPRCKEKQTHLPDPDKSHYCQESGIYTLHYKCSYCPLMGTFLIARESSRLILCGRHRMERVVCAKYIPNDFKKYYSDSLLAYNSGQILPAIFMLRVFAEQVMRNATGITGKMKGDEIADAYAKTLDSTVKEQFPSLKVVYDELSEAMHNAAADPAIYENNKEQIDAHFEGLDVFKRRATQSSPVAEA